MFLQDYEGECLALKNTVKTLEIELRALEAKVCRGFVKGICYSKNSGSFPPYQFNDWPFFNYNTWLVFRLTFTRIKSKFPKMPISNPANYERNILLMIYKIDLLFIK